MPPVGFEPTISAGERPQTYALERAATGTGKTKTINFHDNAKRTSEPALWAKSRKEALTRDATPQHTYQKVLEVLNIKFYRHQTWPASANGPILLSTLYKKQ